MVAIKDYSVDFMHLITLGLINYAQTDLLGLSWNVVGCMGGIRVLLEDGISAGSFARSLVVGILSLIFGSFVG